MARKAAGSVWVSDLLQYTAGAGNSKQPGETLEIFDLNGFGLTLFELLSHSYDCPEPTLRQRRTVSSFDLLDSLGVSS